MKEDKIDCDGCFGSNTRCVLKISPLFSQACRTNCPCNLCIVKVICEESCPERLDYYANANTYILKSF